MFCIERAVLLDCENACDVRNIEPELCDDLMTRCPNPQVPSVVNYPVLLVLPVLPI